MSFGSVNQYPWGHFPTEQYLIENWNFESTEEHSKQCQRLVHAFLQGESPLPASKSKDISSCVPSDEQIQLILKPWRSDEYRWLAGVLIDERDDQVVILRTHYGEHPLDDETLDKMLDEHETVDGHFDRSLWWAVLNDSTKFSFGDSWEMVLGKLPELTNRGAGRIDHFTLGDVDEETVHDALEEYIHQRWDGEDFSYSVGYLQHWFGVYTMPLAVVDEEAFQTYSLKFLFLDEHGNIIRSARIIPEAMGIWRMQSFRGNAHLSETWRDAEVGELYNADGRIGKVLYQKMYDLAALQGLDISEFAMNKLSISPANDQGPCSSNEV